MATKRTVYEYKEKSTGKIINSGSIVADDENGIIVSLGNKAYRFISKDNLSKEIVAASYGYEEKGAPAIPEDIDVSHYDSTEPKSEGISLGEYYDYTFGIDKISLSQTQPKKVSGFVSQDIEIGAVDYIELSVSASKGTNCSVEYYIVDGTDEIPIMPAEDESIIHEHIFNGLPLRFTPDETKPVEIYKNGIKTTLTLKEQSSFNSELDTYTVCYTPISTSRQYKPKNKKIKLKIIERYEIDNAVPVVISAAAILKHGGKKTWTM